MLLSSYFNLLFEKYKKISTHKSWPAALIIFFIVVILINGISLVPPQHYQKLSQNPFITRTDIAPENYWQETVLLPVIAFYTKMNNQVSFSILCFAFIVGAYILFTVFVYKRFGSLPAILFTAILLTGPLATILLSWLGTPDDLTFFLTVPLLFTGSGIVIFILAVLGTMNHITFLIAAVEILALRWVARDNIRKLHLAAVIIGGIIGIIGVKVFLAANHIQAFSRLDYIFSQSMDLWIKVNFSKLPLTLFSLFNIQWLIIPICFIMFFKKDRRYYSSILAMLLFNYGVTFFSQDTTRIFSLLSWGILIRCIFHSYDLAQKEDSAFPRAAISGLDGYRHGHL